MRRRTPASTCRPALLTATVLLGLAGCATAPPPSDPEALIEFRQNNDPLEPSNREVYKFNDGLDTYVLKPIAKGYRAVVPSPIRNGVHNLLSNLSSPIILANDILQAKSQRAGTTFMRLLINTTLGVGGVMDVASDYGYPAHDTDFGVTLALWGVPGGPFLYLPVLGPSNPRDAVGFGTDIALDPFTYVSGGAWAVVGYTRYVTSAVDVRQRHIDDIDAVKKTALDPYATFRSLYGQYRDQVIDKTRQDNRATTPAWYPSGPQ